MAKDIIPFVVGHCVNCGTQTFVTTPTGIPVKAFEGVYLVWICKCDEDGNVVTRIGTVTLCPDCNPAAVDPLYLIQNLLANEFSGLMPNDHELKLPICRIEVVKRYGD